LRRAAATDGNRTARLQVGLLELDPDNQLAYLQGRSIELSDKETQLLSYLMSNPGQVLTHEQIYDRLWGQASAPSSNVLAALVRLLRRKLTIADGTEIVQTVYGKGYRIGGE
jgi:two-component system, OmpR family, manganese sensing response regulator